MRVEGITWMGVRTPAYRGLRELFGTVMGMEVTRDGDGATWFSLPDGEEIQIYPDTEPHHAFFGTGPVIGFRVDDVAAALEELQAAGVELIGGGDRSGDLAWHHFRGPDGNIYEIMGPVRSDG